MFIHYSTLCVWGHTVYQRLRAAVVRVIQPGRHDLLTSVVVTASLLASLGMTPVAAQVGVSETEQLLCSGALNVAQIMTIGLGLVSAYYVLKGMLRMQFGINNAGEGTELVGNDGIRRVWDGDARAYGRRHARGGLYSWAAALLPVIVPAVLAVAGIDYVSCLLP